METSSPDTRPTRNLSAMPRRWQEAIRSPSFRRQLLLTVLILEVLLLAYAHFLDWIQLRPGVVLHDPLLASFQPRKVTWVVFALIYGSLALALGSLGTRPAALLVALQSYALVIAARMAAMYFVPLDPPVRMIHLKDPFVQLFDMHVVLTRDLFFSGHVATLFLLFLTARNRVLRAAFLVVTVVVGTGLIWQHVHYTIDVLAAPFVTFGCYRLVLMAHHSRKPS
ncbi:MAG TPA: phosphatase PAP2-related protein [Syntrophobacteria bacterium]|nr:phosphatase PAP2-related protein [Syntrophobacteria bacterium]